MPDEEQEDDMYLPYRIVPHWGAVPQPDTYFRATFTKEEFRAMAPNLTKEQWIGVWNNHPTPEAMELIRQRIRVAWHLKYGRRQDA